MKQREFPTVFVTRKAELALQSGHPWVYDGEVIRAERCADGGLCDICSEKGRYLGTDKMDPAARPLPQRQRPL